jgi:hypothetical protein
MPGVWIRGTEVGKIRHKNTDRSRRHTRMNRAPDRLSIKKNVQRN